MSVTMTGSGNRRFMWRIKSFLNYLLSVTDMTSWITCNMVEDRDYKSEIIVIVMRSSILRHLIIAIR